MYFTKKIFTLLFAVSLTLPALATSDSTWIKANTLYAEGKYAEALQEYTLLEESDKTNIELLYNIGNTYYKQGQIANAILYYERALKYNSDDEDVLYNLELANLQIVDKIEPVPQFFLVTWIHSVRNIFSIDTWAAIGVGLFVATLALFLLVAFSNSIIRKKLSFIFAVICFCLSLMATYIAAVEKHEFNSRDKAIIFAPVTAIKASPDSSGIDLFVLHEGTKVSVLEAIGDWRKVKTADGNQGWLPASTIEII